MSPSAFLHRSWRLATLGSAALAIGCTPPVLQQGEPSLFQTGPLAFLRDGQTTREEVLMRLGTPNAHFEGDRILTYAFWKFSAGAWIRRGRTWATLNEALRPGYHPPTDDLVLVFGPDGILLRHSLVVAR